MCLHDYIPVYGSWYCLVSGRSCIQFALCVCVCVCVCVCDAQMRVGLPGSDFISVVGVEAETLKLIIRTIVVTDNCLYSRFESKMHQLCDGSYH